MSSPLTRARALVAAAAIAFLSQVSAAFADGTLIILYADSSPVAMDAAALERTAREQQCVFDFGDRSAALWREMEPLLQRSLPGEFHAENLRMKIHAPGGDSYLIDNRGGFLWSSDPIPRLMGAEVFGKLRAIFVEAAQGSACRSPMSESLSLFGGRLPDFQGPLPTTCEKTPASVQKSATLSRAELDQLVARGWEHLAKNEIKKTPGMRAHTEGWSLDGCARIEYGRAGVKGGYLGEAWQVFMRVEDGSLIGIVKID